MFYVLISETITVSVKVNMSQSLSSERGGNVPTSLPDTDPGDSIRR